MRKIQSILSVALLFASLAVFGQGKETLPDMEFEHTKPSDRVTKNAIKLSENPSVEDDTLVIAPLNYTILKKQEKSEYRVEPIKPAKIVDEPLKKLYKHYAKVGFGNYTSPLVEFSMGSLRSKDYTGSVYLKHYSMNGKLKDVGPPQFSDNEIALDGKKFFKDFTLNGNLAYKRNVVHRYGFNPTAFPADSFPSDYSKAAIKQRFSLIGVAVNLSSSELRPSKWLQNIGIDYYNYQDKFKTTENKFGLMANLVKDVSKKSDVLIDAGVDYYNVKMTVNGGNDFIPRLRGAFATSGKTWKLKLGVGTALDVTDSLTKGYIYPQIDFQYSLVENIFYFYAGANGDLQRNSYRSLTTENPFITSDLVLANSSNTNLFAGLRGAFSSKMTFNALIKQSFINNMPYYVNQLDTGDIAGNVFNVVYDKTSLFTVGGDLGFQAGEKLMLNASAFYNFYTMDKQLQPWHRPAITGKFTGKYNLKDKIIVSADLYYLGPQFGRTFAQDSLGAITYGNVKIKGLVDVNLGMEYRYTKRFSAFVNFNNIASYRYYRWSQYPSQRFNFMVGLTANF